MTNNLSFNQRLERLEGLRDLRGELGRWLSLQFEIGLLEVASERERANLQQPWRQALSECLIAHAPTLTEPALGELRAALIELFQRYLDSAQWLASCAGRSDTFGDVMDFIDQQMEQQLAELKAAQ